MGSGESDAIREIKIDPISRTADTGAVSQYHFFTTTGTNTGNNIANGWTCTYGNWHYTGTLCSCTYNWNFAWSNTIYVDRYQIKCPSCKKMNWLLLDKITPCTKCKSKLKAVMEQADYEVEVER